VLAAEEQGTYFQLLRLSYGEGKNFFRAGKRELLERLGLSERRLHRVLDALVAKRFLRPLHRDNRGTLWRVYLPAEAFGEPVGDDVLLGRSGSPCPVEPPAAELIPFRERSPAATPPRPGGGTRTLARAASELARACGLPLAAAERQLTELAEEGATPRQIEACVRAAARRAAIEVSERGAIA
jgi:hypothetical protein